VIRIFQNKYFALRLGFFQIIIAIYSKDYKKWATPFYFGIYTNPYFSKKGVKKYLCLSFSSWHLDIDLHRVLFLKDKLNEKDICFYLRKQKLKIRYKLIFKCWGNYLSMGSCYAGLCGHKCLGCRIEHDCIDSHVTYGCLDYSRRNFPNCDEAFI
jgi:hypothetical protein